MSALLEVILPVFLIIGFGYAAARAALLDNAAIDGIMRFSQNFALPCLLFKSIAALDLSAAYEWGLMASFYSGAFVAFGAGILGARFILQRPMTDSIAIGFACFFSNALLLGLAITERAYGPDALAGNYAIISIHSPFLYAVGITLMEFVRTRGSGASGVTLAWQVLRAIFLQPLVLGVVAGFIANFSGLPQPATLAVAVDMMARAAIPAALFGLGGVLLRYRPEGDGKAIAMVCAFSLLLHPAVTYGIGRGIFDLETNPLRSAVVTASMPPGVNAYLFAHLYGVGKRVAASAVLIATGLSIGSVWLWLQVLG